MCDSQNSRLNNAPVTNDKNDSQNKGGESPKSYYYDDSTGYEIYDEENETEEDADDVDGQSRP